MNSKWIRTEQDIFVFSPAKKWRKKILGPLYLLPRLWISFGEKAHFICYTFPMTSKHYTFFVKTLKWVYWMYNLWKANSISEILNFAKFTLTLGFFPPATNLATHPGRVNLRMLQLKMQFLSSFVGASQNIAPKWWVMGSIEVSDRLITI